MVRDAKAGLVVGIAAALGLAGVALASRKKPEEGPSAKIQIVFYDSEGNVVEHHSPVDLLEGEAYTAVITVTNASTKGGVPCEATLHGTTDCWIMAEGWPEPVYLVHDTFAGGFGPGESMPFYFPFAIPSGSGAAGGVIDVSVTDPDGNVIATASEPVKIISVAIIYGATIDIGIS